MVFFPYALGVLLSSVRNGESLPLWAGICAIAGVLLFVQGFRMLRLKRIILNTPASKVRSASMGLVELTGVANGPTTIPAGITGEACFYYRAVASRLKRSGNRREWQTVADERLCIPFFVEDSTGGLLVNPQGADMDLHSNFKDEFGSSYFSSGDMLPENVAKFLERYDLLASGEVRLEEWCVKPSDPMFVLGTLGKRTMGSEWSALPHSPGARLSFSFGSGLSLSSGRFANKLVNSVIFVPEVSGPLGFGKGPISTTSASQLQAPADAAATTPAPAPASAGWKSVSWEEGTEGRTDITTSEERKAAAPPAPYADVADANSQDDLRCGASSQTAVGGDTNAPPESSADAPLQTRNSQFDMASPVEIGKGASGQPFFVSYRSQREVARMFAWKSALYIWGGPILTLAGLYYLSVYFNWI